MSIWVYHLKKCEKNWGSPCWLRSGRPKCKLPSQLRKIVKATKRYGVQAMNLSARSNILGNIINALEMILNHQRATHFYDNAVKAKHGQYHLWLYVAKVSYFGQFGVDVPVWFLYDFQEMLFWAHILSKTVTKIGGHQVCLEATVRNKSSNHNWEKS